MKKKLVLPVVLFIILLGMAGVLMFVPSEKVMAPTTTTPTVGGNPLYNLIRPTTPAKDSAITSPVSISGEARGGWYFEASFPVEILDAQGKVIGQGPAQAQGDWMTTEFVPFTASITFAAQPAGSKGSVVLKKDNPSGLPENDQSVTIPVTFK